MKNLLVSLLLILVSLGMGYWAKQEFDISRELSKTGISTEAEVIDIIRKTDSDGDVTYKSVFEYTDQSDNLTRVNNNYSSKPAAHEMGEIVEIVYNPNTKEARVSTFWGLYLTPIMLSFIAFIFGGFGLFILNRYLFGVEEYHTHF